MCSLFSSGLTFISKIDKEQPCTKLAEDVIPEGLAIGFVVTGVCALQRKFGVCPRELGMEINPALIPFNQRK